MKKAKYSGVGEIGDVPADVVRVVRGVPDDVELAALVAGIVAGVAAARASHEEIDDGGSTSVWRDPSRRLGMGARPGRASWRWSARHVS